MSKVITKKTKLAGVYAIISPDHKIYVGQSKDVLYRLSKYRLVKGSVKNQTRVYESLLNYGWKQHRFIILNILNPEELDFWERFYISLFNSTDKYFGLNINNGGKRGYKHAPESIKKMSLNNASHKPYRRRQISLEKMGNSYRLGKNHTNETKKKISLSKKGKHLKESTKIKISIAHIGFTHSEESKLKMSKSSSRRREVIDIETGYIYPGVKEAANSINMKYTTLIAQLGGQNRNRTTLKYLKSKKCL